MVIGAFVWFVKQVQGGLLDRDYSFGNDEFVEQLEMKVSAQAEIIDAYRDALQTFQNEKRLMTAMHMHDLKQITEPKK